MELLPIPLPNEFPDVLFDVLVQHSAFLFSIVFPKTIHIHEALKSALASDTSYLMTAFIVAVGKTMAPCRWALSAFRDRNGR
jgi:hypothetical protein